MTASPHAAGALNGRAAPADPSVPLAAPEPRRRRPWITALRAAGTIALVAWIIQAMDWSQVWSAAREARPAPLLLVLLLLAVGPCLSAYKWQQLLAVHRQRFPLPQLTRWYVASIFLSQFLPTTIGGDAYRIYKTLPSGRGRSRPVLAVVVEGASGMAALAAMGFVAAWIVSFRSENDLAAWAVLIGAAGAAVTVLGGWLLWRLPAAAGLTTLRPVARVTAWLGTVGTEFRTHPPEVARAVVLSFLFHLDRIAVIWLTLAALGHAPGFLELTVATTIVEVVSFLPISLGGLGVAEGAFIYGMTRFGAAAEAALAAMLLIRVLLVPLHLLGAWFYFSDQSRTGARS